MPGKLRTGKRGRRTGVLTVVAGVVVALSIGLVPASGSSRPSGISGASHAHVLKRKPPRRPPHIKHVFIIVLENENASTTFGLKSEAPFLSKHLRTRGEYLPNYYGIGHESLDNYIAMISGQAPNVQTQTDCQL